jgi:hypothetical protein
MIIDNVNVFSGYLALNTPQREIATGLYGDMRFDFPRQVKGYASSLQVIGPDNGLFFKLTPYTAGIY